MPQTLNDIQRELAEAELDDGLVVFGWLLTVAAVGLLALAQVLNRALWPGAVAVVVPLLAGAGLLNRAWRRRRLRRLTEQRLGLPYDLVLAVGRLRALPDDLAAELDDVLAAAATVRRLCAEPVWLDLAAEPRAPERAAEAVARRALALVRGVVELAAARASSAGAAVDARGSFDRAEQEARAGLRALRAGLGNLAAAQADLLGAAIASGGSADAAAWPGLDLALAALGDAALREGTGS